VTRPALFYLARIGLLVAGWLVLMVFALRAAALMVDAHKDLQFWLAMGLYLLAFLATIGVVVLVIGDARRLRAAPKGTRKP
jgi:hypothetical protein